MVAVVSCWFGWEELMKFYLRPNPPCHLSSSRPRHLLPACPGKDSSSLPSALPPGHD